MQGGHALGVVVVVDSITQYERLHHAPKPYCDKPQKNTTSRFESHTGASPVSLLTRQTHEKGSPKCGEGVKKCESVRISFNQTVSNRLGYSYRVWV
jgi:hypothetical protein